MKKIYKQNEEPFDKIVLVSGDGDYKMLVDFLIEENTFLKLGEKEKQTLGTNKELFGIVIITNSL
jgi:uncharacterized LabA/DUF88 family protein